MPPCTEPFLAEAGAAPYQAFLAGAALYRALLAGAGYQLFDRLRLQLLEQKNSWYIKKFHIFFTIEDTKLGT